MAANPPSSAATVMKIPTKLPNTPLHRRSHRESLVGEPCARLASRIASPAQAIRGSLGPSRKSGKGARAMLSTIADYTRLTKDMGKSLTQVATEPDVSRDTDYFLSHIGNVKTVDDFLK